MDSSTAIAYINHLGGSKSSTLCSFATDLWEWCLDCRIFLLASHISGVHSALADCVSWWAVERHDTDVKQEHIQEDQNPMGSLSSGLVCNKSHCSVTQIVTGGLGRPVYRTAGIVEEKIPIMWATENGQLNLYLIPRGQILSLLGCC